MFRSGRYGRYISRLLIAADFVVLNAVYFLIVLLNSQVPELNDKILWLLLNIAYLPASIWLKDTAIDRTMHLDRLIKATLLAVITHAAVFMALLYVMSAPDVPWQVLLQFYAAVTVSFVLCRSIGQRLLKRYRMRGGNIKSVVIVGCRNTAERLYFEMKADPGYGYNVKGFYDIYCPPEFKHRDLYGGNIDDLSAMLEDNKIDDLYYTLSGEDGETVQYLVGLCDRKMIRFNYVPQMSSYLARNLRPETIGAVPVLAANRNPLDNPVNTAIKRTFDILFSGAFLLVSPIVFIPVAVAVKLSSPGPVFFRQLRTGYKGKDFYCLKFRTMRVNSLADTMQASRTDPRKTRVGEFLRRTSIDELPQFINVFLGDMSVVGPRPHMLKHTADYSRVLEKYMVRHLIKPGITGWAQVRGYRGQTNELWQMEKRVEHDIWYMEHWSFLLDCKIIARTFFGMFIHDENAF